MNNIGKALLINALPSLSMTTDNDRFFISQFVIDNADEIAKNDDVAPQILQGLFAAQGAYNHVIRDNEEAPDFNLSVDMRALLSAAEDALTGAMNRVDAARNLTDQEESGQ